MDTGRDAESATVVSRLSLARAMAEDTGNYTCRLAKMPRKGSKGLTDTITVHVLRGENTEAIQGGLFCQDLDLYVEKPRRSNLTLPFSSCSFWVLDLQVPF